MQSWCDYPVRGIGTFVITDACDDPEALIKWGDFFYSPEGTTFAAYGTEGEPYTLDENGQIVYCDDILNYDGGAQLGAPPEAAAADAGPARHQIQRGDIARAGGERRAQLIAGAQAHGHLRTRAHRVPVHRPDRQAHLQPRLRDWSWPPPALRSAAPCPPRPKPPRPRWCHSAKPG